jgi:ribonuclease III
MESASARRKPSGSRRSVRPLTSSLPTRRNEQPDDSADQLRSLFDSLPGELAKESFSHSSWVAQRSSSYERLAFLGDSVLNLAVSTVLFPRFARHTAGNLTKIRAQAVSRRSCVDVARKAEVPDRMRAVAPAGQEEQVEALIAAESVLAEALEAGIGACFLEQGFERTSEAVAAAFAPQIEEAVEQSFDFKSELQERLAQRGEIVTYAIVDEQGPPHDRRFETVAEVDGRQIGVGRGRSKKESEQEAARLALEGLDD